MQPPVMYGRIVKRPASLLRPALPFLFAFCFLLSGCTDASPDARYPPPAAANVIRIVSSLPTHGQDAVQGKLMAQAIDLAIDRRGGKVGGWAIDHVRLDSSAGEAGEWSVERESAAATEAANDPSVVAYIGPYTSGGTGVSLPITNKAGLLQLGPSATWPGLARAGWNGGEPEKYFPTGQRTLFRLMFDDSNQARAAANWAASLNQRRFYVLSDKSTYSDGLAAQFYTSAMASGLDLIGRDAINPEDMPALTNRISQVHPDAVFYAPSSPRAAAKVAQALAGLRVFASDTALSDQFLEAAGQNAQNWFIVSNAWAGAPQTSRWNQFARDFKARYGQEPTQFAGNTFDVTNLVLDAIAFGAGRDREKLRDLVSAVHGYEGVTGPISFDEFGDIRGGEMSGYRVQNGKFVVERALKLAP